MCTYTLPLSIACYLFQSVQVTQPCSLSTAAWFQHLTALICGLADKKLVVGEQQFGLPDNAKTRNLPAKMGGASRRSGRVTPTMTVMMAAMKSTVQRTVLVTTKSNAAMEPVFPPSISVMVTTTAVTKPTRFIATSPSAPEAR